MSRRSLPDRGWGPVGRALILLAPVAASAVFLVWTRVTTLRLGYELARAQTALRALEEENRVLGTAVSALRSPERLRSMATRRFQLRPPSAEQVAKASVAPPPRGRR